MPKETKSDAELAIPHFQHPQPQSQGNPAYGQVFSENLNQADLLSTIAALAQRIELLEQKRINFNTDIIGLYQTTTLAPTTTTPTNPYQQVQITVIAGTTKLNVYDSLNKVWKAVTLT